jgi:hypothetical protein
MGLHVALGLGLAALTLGGCDSIADDGEGGDPPGCGGTRCGDLDPCADAGTEAVDWMQTLDGGDSPEQVFASAEGSCEAPFTWDGAGHEPHTVDPPSGESTVTVTVELDRDSARVNRSTSRGATGSRCEAVLAVDGRASVRTDDGVFDDEADVTLTVRESGGSSSFGFQVALEDIGGTLSVALGERESGTLSYQLSGADAACAGEVNLGITSSRGNLGMSSRGTLASWSSSGCPVGESPFDPGEPAVQGTASVAETITAVWTDASYPGEWDDGEPTELNVSVEVLDRVACRQARDDGAVLIPVRATYGTADGRIEPHAVDATVRATFGKNGETRGLALWIDDALRCEDVSDVLPYTLAGCDELEAVQIQLGIDSNNGAITFSDSGLNAYEEHREGTAQAGGADRLRTLVLQDD